MKKHLLLIGLAAAALATPAAAQGPLKIDTARKWDGNVALLLSGRQPAAPMKAAGKSTAPQGVALIVSCTDSRTVAAAIEADGYAATAIGDGLVTTNVPASYVPTLAELPEVTYVNYPRTHAPLLTEARADCSVDAIHQGRGLETPFTGKGVLVGIIDQGFEYRHAAFLDAEGNSRVKQLWNRSSYGSGVPSAGQTLPTDIIPEGGDGMDSGGHATHVTNIAAGSVVDGVDYYGMAPDADIYMIPSTFSDAEVVEDVQAIKEYAESKGQPWVVNMSFGSQIGPHDGTTVLDQGVSALTGPGGFVVAAMGNEGDQQLHVTHTFESDGEDVYILIDANEATDGYVYFDLWGQDANGRQNLQVEPFCYRGSRISYPTDAQWRTIGQITTEISPYNRKEHYSFWINTTGLTAIAGTGTGTPQFGVKVTGNAGSTIHGWCNPGYGEISAGLSPLYNFLRGDNEYCVGEGASTVPTAVSVAAYTTSNTIRSLDGNTYRYDGAVGALAPFSSIGPFLGSELKPTVAAPGHVIKSAVSSYTPSFNASSYDLVASVRNGLRTYYYGAKSGTSMATPAVTGIIALWLEAYPELTRSELQEVLRTTSRHDISTGTEEWNARWGYGKIDAYDGLRAVLRLAESSGLHDQLNSEAPVSLSKGGDAWKILFNTDESFADVSLYTTSGACVSRRHLDQPRRGDEVSVGLSGLTPGVYVLNIATTKSSTTRKVVVD